MLVKAIDEVTRSLPDKISTENLQRSLSFGEELRKEFSVWDQEQEGVGKERGEVERE